MYKWCSRRSTHHHHMSYNIFIIYIIFLCTYIIYIQWFKQYDYDMIIGMRFRLYHVFFVIWTTQYFSSCFKPTVEKQNTKFVISMNSLFHVLLLSVLPYGNSLVWIVWFTQPMLSPTTSRVLLNSVIRLKLLSNSSRKDPTQLKPCLNPRRSPRMFVRLRLKTYLNWTMYLMSWKYLMKPMQPPVVAAKSWKFPRLRGSKYGDVSCLGMWSTAEGFRDQRHAKV